MDFDLEPKKKQVPAPLVYVHRDLGPGFTHFDSKDCGCHPHVIFPFDERKTEEILAEIKAKERKQ